MRALLCCTFVAVVAVTGVLLAQSAEKEDAMHGSAREKLIGAWHLVSMEEPGAFSGNQRYRLLLRVLSRSMERFLSSITRCKNSTSLVPAAN